MDQQKDIQTATREQTKPTPPGSSSRRHRHIPSWYASIDKLRLILTFFVCINLFGFPTKIGGYVQALCGFVAPAFFLLSGFLVLRESENREKRILRAVKRSGCCFAVLAVVYALASYLYGGAEVFRVFASKRIWADFLLLNLWPLPIGVSIWYVQALFYGYVILYFAEKWKLLRWDWLVMTLLLVVTLLVGELSPLLGFSFLGRSYIPGCFLTRALPYQLMGCLIRRKRDYISKLRPVVFVLCAVAGFVAMWFELPWLNRIGGYSGHLAGMILAVPSVCMLSLLVPEAGFRSGFMDGFSVFAPDWVYNLCPIAGVWIGSFLIATDETLTAYTGLVTFVFCICVLALCFFVMERIRRHRRHKKSK